MLTCEEKGPDGPFITFINLPDELKRNMQIPELAFLSLESCSVDIPSHLSIQWNGF